MAQFKGTEIDRRVSFYFYKALEEALETERAQLTEAKDVTVDSMLKFGVASEFMGKMGAKYPARPSHLVELARDVRRINSLMYFVVMDEREYIFVTDRETGKDIRVENPGFMLPALDDDDGYSLIKPYLDRLYEKYTVMLFRSIRTPTVRKWLTSPEEQIKEDTKGAFAKLIGMAETGSEGGES
jgi:hypothetical protein